MSFIGVFMATEIILIVTGTLLSVVMQYIHSLAGFGHSAPRWLLIVTRVRMNAETAACYANNNGTSTDYKQQSSSPHRLRR